MLYPRKYSQKGVRKPRVVWWYWYYDENDNRVAKSTGCELKYEAEAFLRDLSDKMAYGIVPYFGEYVKNFFIPGRCSWLALQEAKGKGIKLVTARLRRAHIEQYLLPQYQKLRLDEINAVGHEKWLLKLPLKNSSRNQITYTLNIILKNARREGIIRHNPISDVEPMSVKADRDERSPLSTKEMELLFPISEKRFKRIWPVPMYGVLYALMVSSGMRSGEIRALQWKHVIWDLGQSSDDNQIGAVSVLQAFDRAGNLDLPKKNERRGIILPDRTMKLLNYWHERSKPSPEDWIFSNYKKPVTARTITVNLHRGIGRLNTILKEEGQLPITNTITPHSLRHTYNTMMRDLLLENNIPEEYLRHMTGHKSISMTDHYDHKEVDRRTRALLPIAEQVNDFWKN